MRILSRGGGQDLFQRVADVRFVVDDQEALHDVVLRCGPSGALSGVREPDGETAPPAGPLRGDLAAVGLDDAAADGQAQAQAGILRAHVGVEDLIGRFRGDPRSVVGDRDRDPASPALAGAPAGSGRPRIGAAVGQGVEAN